LAFGRGIQPFGRFIQQHQRRIVQQRARNRQTAQLAAGKLTTAFTQPAFSPSSSSSLSRPTCSASRIAHHWPRRRQQQVIAQRGAEQMHALRHDADGLAQRGFAEGLKSAAR
jgi:hypothetical protein